MKSFLDPGIFLSSALVMKYSFLSLPIDLLEDYSLLRQEVSPSSQLSAISHHWQKGITEGWRESSPHRGILEQRVQPLPQSKVCLFLRGLWNTKSNLGTRTKLDFWNQNCFLHQSIKVLLNFLGWQVLFSPPPFHLHLSCEVWSHGVLILFHLYQYFLALFQVFLLFWAIFRLLQLVLNSTTSSFSFQNHKLFWFLHLSILQDYTCPQSPGTMKKKKFHCSLRISSFIKHLIF